MGENRMPKRNILCLILCIFFDIYNNFCLWWWWFKYIYYSASYTFKISSELSKTEFKLNVGSTDNIIVTLNGENITKTATYKVDQESIAKVEGGLITGLSVGLAIVTVSAEKMQNQMLLLL